MAQNAYEYNRAQNLANLASHRGQLLDRVREILESGQTPYDMVERIRRLLETRR